MDDVMIVECSHCHVRIVTTADGFCPGCRKNPLDPTEHTVVHLLHGSTLPSVCIHCGLPTERFVDFCRSNGAPRPFGLLNVVLFLVSAALGSFALIWRDSQLAPRREIRIALPRCEHCRDAVLQPERVDFATRSIVLVAHRRFAEAVEHTPQESASSRDGHHP
jgi:hypothetical protein